MGPKIRSFKPPVAKLWPNIFQYISIYFTKSWFALVCHQLDQKQKYFQNDRHWTTSGLQRQWESTPEPPQKNVSFRKCDFSVT